MTAVTTVATTLPDHPDVREDYTLVLVATTALHIGAPSDDGVTDLPLATDGQGQLLVPGTSWAGVLRATASRHLPGELVDSIFGFQGQEDEDGGHASRLFVSDTIVAAGQVELRNGVGIDRRRAAAAERLLYDRLVLPAGTGLELRLRYEGPDTDGVERLVGIVRAAGLRIGAGTGRGLGRLDCTSATALRTDLTSRSAVLALLTGTAEPTDVAPSGGVTATGLRFELAWSPRRPVIVGGPAAGKQADLVPVLTASGAGLAPLLPGSSVKGVLRGAAERVIRTVRDLPRPDPDAVAALNNLARAVPAHGEVFGSRDRRGALSVADTVAGVEPVSREDWLQYVSGNAQSGWLSGGERTHVAIDRWTGGAAESRLFTVQETTGVTWPPLVLELDLHRVAEGRRRAAVTLLGVTIGLLLDGQLGLGHGTTRGLGEPEIESVTVTGMEPFGLPTYRTGTDWWAWLREVAAGADLVELLEEAGQNA
jgi:CRISPR/Cas system CSM-associated protein Csm3 (group 7 of RAMP superfamily)